MNYKLYYEGKSIAQAKNSLTNSGGIVDNHFRDITKMVEVGGDYNVKSIAQIKKELKQRKEK